MNILYIYCKSHLNLEEVELNFSGLHRFQIVESDETYELHYSTNEEYPNLILDFPNTSGSENKGIIGVTAVVGMNGTGKSHCLNLLKNILTDDLDFEQEVLVCYEIKGEIYCKHRLNKTVTCRNENINPQWSVQERSLIERINYEQAGMEAPPIYKLTVSDVKTSRIIYYSSHADLQSYPNGNLFPQHTDVSTNFLLQVDKQKGEEYIKEKFDPILSHKYQDALRMIDLVYSDVPYPKIISDFIPKSINLLLSGDINFPRDTRNLNGSDEEFIERFKKLCNENWMEANLKERETPFLYNAQAIAHHCRTSLCYNMLAHYFLNKEDVFEADSQITISDINWNASLVDITKSFFVAQKWVDSSKTLNLFTDLLSLIDVERSTKKLGGGPGFEIELQNKTEVVNLTTSYYHYLNVYTYTSHPGGLINFFSRPLSSGEKSMLTLFSRLYSASLRQFKNPDESEPVKNFDRIDTIMLLLDEGDASFHPEWQLRYFQFLHEFLPVCFKSYNIQLVLTSHSPFILSDLPRENVIFLNKKNGRTVVENPISIKKTFGGNIHELLASSFFLDEGLIGKYAQSKINSMIAKIQSKEKLSHDAINQYRKLILSIGESVIRSKLLQMLAEKKALDEIAVN